MRLRNFLRAWRGQLVLSALMCLRTFCCVPGGRTLYRNVLTSLIKKTRLFDERFYLENNPDIAESGMGALYHYVAYGDREGRTPMAIFDPVFYRRSISGWTRHINALLHFTYVGRYGRSMPSPWFDVNYYLANNKDVARAGIDPLSHYLEWGGVEGRSPCQHFDGAYYLRKNPDIAEARVNPLLHYLEHGRFEGRRTVPDFHAGYPDGEAEEIPLPICPADDEWKTLRSCRANEKAEVDVVVPVYKGMAETLRCIFSVLSAQCKTEFELIVINDDSPEQELVWKLKELAASGLFTLLENDENRGFVYTVNRGMLLHIERDVVLLNSDTEVYAGWLDRMKSAGQGDRVATVTPLSNNATICSYPYFLHDNPYPLEMDYRELDALIADCNKGKKVEAPTGVGFCMLVKRSGIAEVGLFDEETFGKGYGEENDFCQRAIKKGWRNIIAADVFVRHWGSVSFKGEKAVLASNALKRVEKKHPSYLSDVDRFIKNEPLAKIHEHIDWVRLERLKKKKNVLLISHNRGGGTERRVQEDITRYVAEGCGVYLIRPVPGSPDKFAIGHPAARWLPNISPIEWRNDIAIRALVKDLEITDVISHSFVDFVKIAPSIIQGIIQDLDLNWLMNLHDYEVICPRINLVDEKGFYCHEPEEDSCNKCLRQRGSIFSETDIANWRAKRGSVMQTASKVIVPDNDVKDRLCRYYSGVNIEVIPHEDIGEDDVNVKPIKVRSDEKLKVVVIGAISKMKGFDVLRRCARDAVARNLPIKFVLMGYSLNDKVLEESGVEVTGQYKEEEAKDVLDKLMPHIVWVPSLWPETYSYTLSIGLKSGYPVMAFDIGAIARRMRELCVDPILLSLELAGHERVINSVLCDVWMNALSNERCGENRVTEFAVAVPAYE